MTGQDTLCHLLDDPAALVPEALVCRDDRSDLGRFLSRFPSDFADCLLLERLLANTDRGVDVTLLVGPEDDGRRMLTGTHDGLPATWFDAPAWRHARAAARRSSQWVLLEIDAEQFSKPCPVPHLFLSPASRGLEGATECLTWLHGDAPAGTVSAPVLDCLRSIPQPYGLCLMGKMLGRGEDDVRVLVTFRELEALKRCLEAVGWPGDPASEPGFDLIPEQANCFLLNLEVGSSVGRRIGIEPYFWFLSDQGAGQRWNAYLSQLRQAGLCTPEEADALLRFPGPAGDGLRSSVSTKMVFDDDLRVKAYLSIDGGN